MTYRLIFILTFGLAVCKGQSTDSIVGKYSSTCNAAIESWTLSLNKNKTFEHHFNGHLMSDKVDKGTWTIDNGILVLKIKKKVFTTYLISKNQLCEILVDKDIFCDHCLNRQ